MTTNSKRDLDDLSGSSKEARKRSLEALARARRDKGSLASALRTLRAEGRPVGYGSLQRYAGPGLTRDERGRLVPTKADHLYRLVPVLTIHGQKLVDTHSSREATIAAEHRNAVRAFYEGDDPSGDDVQRFRGVRVGGELLETDLDVLEQRAYRQEIDLLSEEGS